MKKVFCLCVLLALVLPTVYAKEKLYDALEVSEVISAAPREADIEFRENISFENGLGSVFEKVFSGIRVFLTQGIRCVGVICAVSFLVGFAESFMPSGDNGALKVVIALVGALSVTVTASGSITSVIGMGKEFISGVDAFSKALIPSVAAAEAASGFAGSATVKAGIALVFSDVLISFINSVLLPLVYINIFAGAANAASKNSVLQKISEFSVKFVSWSLRVLLGAFVSYIGISGIVTAGADKAALSTAQLAIGAAVPVVGSIVSEAAETVMSGATMMKNAIGVFGMLSILSAFATPFAAMLVNFFAFKAASLVSSPVLSGGISELSSKIAESFGLIIAMCASVATVIIIAVIAAMKSVGVV